MLSVIMLSVVMLSVIILSVVMLNVIMLSIVMLNVVALCPSYLTFFFVTEGRTKKAIVFVPGTIFQVSPILPSLDWGLFQWSTLWCL